jgi:hypothetical protein
MGEGYAAVRNNSIRKGTMSAFGTLQALAFKERQLGAIWNLRIRLVILRRISTGAFTGLAEFAVASGVCEIT